MIDNDNVFKVCEITAHVKNILEKSIGYLQVEGEVSNLSKPSSGHLYFSLKDEKALIKCVFFSGFNKSLELIPKNGDKVLITGKVTIYERDGQLQILVSKIQAYGIGALHEQFEKLKAKLLSEGLFDAKHKKQLPKYPKSIGIITSESGAALQDILKIISRRFPVEIFLYPAVVQGIEAPKSLKSGIEYFSNTQENNFLNNSFIADVIIIGRGGGSYEDLFCFNDESLARAIYKCPIPMISAVGHEIDYTICDFVADIRAATPSAAAEIAVPDRFELLNLLEEKNRRLLSLTNKIIQDLFKEIMILDKKMQEYNPQNLIYKYQQRIDLISLKMLKFKSIFEKVKEKFFEKNQIFNTYHPEKILSKRKNYISTLSTNLLHNFKLKFSHQQKLKLKSDLFSGMYLNNFLNLKNNKKIHLNFKLEKINFIVKDRFIQLKSELQKKKKLLKSLSPKYILQKGYSFIEKDGKIIKTQKKLKLNDKIAIILKDGQCQAEIKE